MRCSPTSNLAHKSHVTRGCVPLIAPSTATCPSMWRFFLSLPPTSTFWLNLAPGSFKLVCHGSRLLVVEWGARIDKVHLVEWDSWVLHNESDLAALSRSRVYHGLQVRRGTRAVTSLNPSNDFENGLVLPAVTSSRVTLILTVVFSNLPCSSEVNSRVSRLSSVHFVSLALRGQFNNPRLPSSAYQHGRSVPLAIACSTEHPVANLVMLRYDEYN